MSTIAAGVYVRISEDAAGQGLGVARQESDCRALATAKGWTVHAVYSDNDLSASSGKRRPEYERMLSDVRDGILQAVVVYNLDRLTRRPTELEEFITLAETHGTYLANVSGDIDLSTANGKMIARMTGAFARAETDRLAERVSRQRLQAVQLGKPLGQQNRTFGYDKNWNIIEGEAEIIRELYQMRINGSSVRNVYKRACEALDGIHPPTGKKLYYQTVDSWLTNPRFAALQPYKGQEYPGKWQPIITVETFRAAQAIERGKKHSKGHNARKNLLTGFLYCGKCDSRMSSRPEGNKNTRTYACRVCMGTTIGMAWLDDIILKEVGFRARQTVTVKAPTVDYAARINDLEEKITELKAGFEAGQLTYADYAEPLNAFRKQIATLQQEQGEQEQAKKQNLFRNYQDLLAADLSQRRVIIAKYIRAIRISRRLPGDRLNRVTVSWVEGYDENLGEKSQRIEQEQAQLDKWREN